MFVRPKHEIRLLTYNLALEPKSVVGDTYQEERVADMFKDGNFDEFDVICVQKCSGGVSNSVKELFIVYA